MYTKHKDKKTRNLRTKQELVNIKNDITTYNPIKYAYTAAQR